MLTFPRTQAKELLMQVLFHHRHTHVSQGIHAAAVEKLAKLERYLHGIDRAEVIFNEQPTARAADREMCEVSLHGKGHHFVAKATAAHPGAALELVVAKLEQQLLTRKGRLISRSHPRRRVG